MVNFIKEYAPDLVDVKNNAGETACDVASSHGHNEIVTELLSKRPRRATRTVNGTGQP